MCNMMHLTRLLFCSFFPLVAFAVGPQLSDCDGAMRAVNAPEWTEAPVSKSVRELVEEHRDGKEPLKVETLRFDGLGPDKTVYNPAGWFDTTVGGKPIRVFAGRVESLDSETDTEVGFFVEGRGKLAGKLVPTHVPIPTLHLQDPFVKKVGDELVIGGVKVETDANGHVTSWSTVMYRDHGKGLDHLTPFFKGPKGMKDIRLSRLGNGQILVLTRPQGKRKGGPGKVGYLVVDGLDDLADQGAAGKLENAPLIPGMIPDADWMGSNDPELLANGNLGVLCHLATWKGSGKRKYAAGTFGIKPVYRKDPATGKWKVNRLLFTPPKVLFERADFPGALGRSSKRTDLKDVVFPGKAELAGDKLVVYGGEGDRTVFRLELANPFTHFASEDSGAIYEDENGHVLPQ